MKTHKGLFVGVRLSPDAAAKLALANGEPADQLHVTLCYCADVEELGADVVARVLDVLGRVAASVNVCTGQVSGIGRFQASDTSDGKDVLYASIDMPGLVELRVTLSEALTAAGAPPRDDHGFDPHITLCYLSPDDPNPIDRIPAVELRLDALTVEAGAERRLFTLQVTEENMAENNSTAVKFTGVNKDTIEGYGIPFGGPFNGKDLHKQFFSAKTDFAFDWFTERPLLYGHGFDEDIELEPVGRVKTYVVKDKGVWVTAQLDKSHKYFKDIETLVDEGKLYFSSGSVDHLVQVNRKSGEIEVWPWIEQSLTPTPANLFGTLDFATAEKHCKSAGIDMPIAVKDAMAARSRQTVAVKGLLKRLLEERNSTIWQMWSSVQCAFEEIAKAASVSGITGVDVDLQAAVTAVMAEFNSLVIPAVVEQIREYLSQDRNEQPFYIKSVSLDALLNDNSHVGLSFKEHLEQVHAAAVGVLNRAEEIHAIRSTKEGRTFSAASLQQLSDLHGQMGDCHAKMGTLIEKGKPKEKEPAKSAGLSAKRARDLRFLSLKQHQLSGNDAATTEA